MIKELKTERYCMLGLKTEMVHAGMVKSAITSLDIISIMLINALDT